VLKWFAILMLSSAAWGQNAQADAAKYQAMVKRVLGGDTGVDFRELRALCMRVPECRPRSTAADLAAMQKADPREAIRMAEKLLPTQLANVELYSNLANYYKQTGNAQQSARYLAIATRLMAPALTGKDGKTPRTAFEVISARETFYILTARGLPYHGDGVLGVDNLTEGGHKYERWRVRDKSSQVIAVYFNVDAFQPKSTAVK
jgi:hypothetical protein